MAVPEASEGAFVVYILRSESSPQHFYVGMTSNMDARIRQHNSSGNKHTSKHQPWKPIVTIHFTDEAKARNFEAYLKGGSGRAFAKRHFSQE